MPENLSDFRRTVLMATVFVHEAREIFEDLQNENEYEKLLADVDVVTSWIFHLVSHMTQEYTEMTFEATAVSAKRLLMLKATPDKVVSDAAVYLVNHNAESISAVLAAAAASPDGFKDECDSYKSIHKIVTKWIDIEDISVQEIVSIPGSETLQ